MNSTSFDIETIRTHLENIIKETFDIIDELYDTNKEDSKGTFVNKRSRLVFPKYREKDKNRKNEIRLSEQELRFLFIERFNKYCEKNNVNLFYSIETPSEEPYKFGKESKEHCEKGGVSAQFDMVIYNKNKERVGLIEFKNNSGKSGEHEKDFLKLSVEGGGKLCYFISIAKASNSGTLGETNNSKGIIHKFKEVAKNGKISFDNITYICHCLDDHNGKGFKTIFAGTIKSNFPGWVKKDELFKNDHHHPSRN